MYDDRIKKMYSTVFKKLTCFILLVKVKIQFKTKFMIKSPIGEKFDEINNEKSNYN
jgi:hypothetical protein